MRKNCRETVRHWLLEKPSAPAQQGKSIWTDGRNIYSYQTCLVTRSPWAGTMILNRTRYSQTTTVHQNALAVRWPWSDPRPQIGSHVAVDNVRWGADPKDLREAFFRTLP